MNQEQMDHLSEGILACMVILEDLNLLAHGKPKEWLGEAVELGLISDERMQEILNA